MAASFTRRRFGSKGCQRSVRPFACSVVIPSCRPLFSITSFPSATSSILWSGPTPIRDAASFGCPRPPPPAVTSRRTLMGLIGSGMCLSDVTCPQPPAEHPLSRITRTAVLLSLVRAPALPPRHAYFGSQSHTPYDRCLRFGPRVAATPARLAPVPPAQLWTDQTCTGKLISASPIAPRIRLPPRIVTAKPCGRPYALRRL